MGRIKRIIDALWQFTFGSWFRNLTDSALIEKIQTFMEDEARSCSMDFGRITPEYVYRMWGGSVAIDDITAGLVELRKL